MNKGSICVFCHQSFVSKRLAKYCSKQCKQQGHKQTLLNKRQYFLSIIKCRNCGTDISQRKYLTPYCKPCLKRINKEKKQAFKNQICHPSKPENIQPKLTPEYIERGDLCFQKMNRRDL